MSTDEVRQAAKAIIATMETKLIEVLARSPDAPFKITLNIAPPTRGGYRKWNTEVCERTEYSFAPPTD